MLAGDSVPLRLQAALDRGAESRGWRIVSATFGACPVSGEGPVRADGRPLPATERCLETVVPEQDRVIASTDPDVVVWWDRFSLANFRTHEGRVVVSGTDGFWKVRAATLRRTVNRLGRSGATVVLVATEPPGNGIEQLCASRERGCSVWGRFQIEHYTDVTTRWNGVLRTFAEAHPSRVTFVDFIDDVCRTDVAPCDDRIRNVVARPDGTHYEGPGETLAVRLLLDALVPLVPEAAPSACCLSGLRYSYS
jgi:hypothetical protein